MESRLPIGGAANSDDPTSPSATSSYSTATKEIHRRHGPTSPISEPKVPSSFPPGVCTSPSILPASPSLHIADRIKSPLQTSMSSRSGSRLQTQYRPRQPPGSTQPDLSFRALVARHQYLLTTMAILAVLCTIYLYFAISMDDGESSQCGGLRGKALADCRLMLQAQRNAAKMDSGGLEEPGSGNGGVEERLGSAAGDADGRGSGDRHEGGRKAKVVYEVEV